MVPKIFVGASAEVEIEEFDQDETCGCLQRVWPIQFLPSADNPLAKLRLRVKVGQGCSLGHDLWKSRLHTSDEPHDADLDKGRPRTQSIFLGELAVSDRTIVGQTPNVRVTQRYITEKCGCRKIGLTFEMVPDPFVIKGTPLVLVVYRRTVVGENCPANHQLGFRKPRWLRKEGIDPIADVCHKTGRSVNDVIKEYQGLDELYKKAEEQGILKSEAELLREQEYEEEDNEAARPGW